MLDLEPIRERLAAATPGKWRRGVLESTGEWSVRREEAWTYPPICEKFLTEADAKLVEKAPSDIAALIAEVERLRAAPVAEPLTCPKCGAHHGVEAHCSECDALLDSPKEVESGKCLLCRTADRLEASGWNEGPTTGANPLPAVGQTWRNGKWECRITEKTRLGFLYAEWSQGKRLADGDLFEVELLAALLSGWSLDGAVAGESGEWEAKRLKRDEEFHRMMCYVDGDPRNGSYRMQCINLRSDLAAAQEQIATLTAERDEAKRDRDNYEDAFRNLSLKEAAAATEARAEVERLKAALESEKLVVDLMTKRGNEFADGLLKTVKERDDARAEVERLGKENHRLLVLIGNVYHCTNGDPEGDGDELRAAQHFQAQHAAALDALRAVSNYHGTAITYSSTDRPYVPPYLPQVRAVLAGLPAQAGQEQKGAGE